MSERNRGRQEAGLGRIGRSWSRALLDVLLIVGSILIAFALDAWWDGRAREGHEREALRALAEELRSSRVELDSVVAFNEGRLAATRYFHELSADDVIDLPYDSLLQAMEAGGGGMTFDPSLGATEAIVAAGLDLITSAELRARIAAWPGTLREIEVDQTVIVERWEKVSDAFVGAGLESRLFGLYESEVADTAAVRSFVRSMVGEPEVRERVAGLGLSITELLDELTEVDGRLAELESSVAAELDLRVRPGRG